MRARRTSLPCDSPRPTLQVPHELQESFTGATTMTAYDAHNAYQQLAADKKRDPSYSIASSNWLLRSKRAQKLAEMRRTGDVHGNGAGLLIYNGDQRRDFYQKTENNGSVSLVFLRSGLAELLTYVQKEFDAYIVTMNSHPHAWREALKKVPAIGDGKDFKDYKGSSLWGGSSMFKPPDKLDPSINHRIYSEI